jgi:hypothetical protein
MTSQVSWDKLENSPIFVHPIAVDGGKLRWEQFRNGDHSNAAHTRKIFSKSATPGPILRGFLSRITLQ